MGFLDAYDTVTESELLETANIVFPPYDSLPPSLVGHMHKKYGTISLIIPHLKSDAERNSAIEICAKKFDVSKATIRHRLCQYLTFQDVRIFLPTSKASEKPLSDDEKNFRWALNKYYYSAIKIPLTETYILDKKPYRKSCFSTLQRKEERFFCDFWRSSVYI